MDTPKCLHIPELITGVPADIFWQAIDGARGYTVERKLPGGEFKVIYEGEGSPVFSSHSKYTWREIDELGCTSAMIDESALTWRQIDCVEHVGFMDEHPVVGAQYRVKADVGISVSATVAEGDSCFFVVGCEGLNALSDKSVVYDPEALSLSDFTAHIPNGDDPLVQITTQEPGCVLFDYSRAVPDGSEWSGPVTLIEFTALVTGSTVVELR